MTPYSIEAIIQNADVLPKNGYIISYVYEDAVLAKNWILFIFFCYLQKALDITLSSK
jgi:hypothetical protein